MPTRPKQSVLIGEMLVSLGRITPDTLSEALHRQADLPGTKIGRILIDLGVPEEVVTEALAKQSGIEWTRLTDRIIPSEIARRVTSDFAKRYKIVPFEETGGKLRVATSDPSSLASVDMVGRFLGVSVEPVLVSDTDLEIALQRTYGREADLKAVPPLSAPARPDRAGVGMAGDPSAGTDSFVTDGAAVRVLDGLIQRAVRDGASDIHIEPFEKTLRVRHRIDGVLHEVGIEPVSPKSLVARCKILASLDAAETRRPQDGRFRATAEGRTIDIRISTVLTAFGEKVVLRLLDRSRALLDLSALGMGGETLPTFRKAINRPHGLILVTGPTGSGKTTTLYAALSERNDRGLNLTTIEDPVEYDLFGVNQIQVHHKIKVDFAKGLRHVLRQDPDIILVGEIRDSETAEVAIQAALTGHLARIIHNRQ